MIIVESFDAVRETATGSVGLVPTMGFLHEGHLSLIEEAARNHHTVVMSLFVNPLQFGEASDLDRYPRDLERDVDLAGAAGADIVFAPTVDYMYPEAPATTVTVAGVADAMEGATRPGHFAGVATVVAKLFAGVQPHAAYFGRKDAQQLAVVTTMARDLSMPVDVVGLPIVREADGLALSSRNVRLDPDARTIATALSRALVHGADLFEAGERSVSVVRDSVRSTLVEAGIDRIEYVELADETSAAVASEFSGRQFLATAARVGDVRLIDNVTLDSGTSTADRGVRLTEPSILYGGA